MAGGEKGPQNTRNMKGTIHMMERKTPPLLPPAGLIPLPRWFYSRRHSGPASEAGAGYRSAPCAPRGGFPSRFGGDALFGGSFPLLGGWSGGPAPGRHNPLSPYTKNTPRHRTSRSTICKSSL